MLALFNGWHRGEPVVLVFLTIIAFLVLGLVSVPLSTIVAGTSNEPARDEAELVLDDNEYSAYMRLLLFSAILAVPLGMFLTSAYVAQRQETAADVKEVISHIFGRVDYTRIETGKILTSREQRGAAFGYGTNPAGGHACQVVIRYQDDGTRPLMFRIVEVRPADAHGLSWSDSTEQSAEQVKGYVDELCTG